MLGKTRMNVSSFDLCTRLSQESEHVALVRFYARLVKGVDAKHVASYGTGDLEEVHGGSKTAFRDIGYGQLKYGDTTVVMSKKSADPGIVVHGRLASTVELGKSVRRVRIADERDIDWGGHIEDRLKERWSPFLDELPKRVKISCEFC